MTMCLLGNDILAKEGYSFVVPKFFLIASDKNIAKDITSQIIIDLNKSLPKLSDSDKK
ncbi:MAG: hypothetical protein OEY79_04415 [Anaplasmataceae bacterium]|nr:hypothetical protein [Anaplasmataceae bacterium]